jgi:hypothetical protein
MYTNPLHQTGVAQAPAQQQQQQPIIIYAILLPKYNKFFFLHLLSFLLVILISIGIAYLVDGSFKNWELALYMSITIMFGIYLLLCCAYYVCRREPELEDGQLGIHEVVNIV